MTYQVAANLTRTLTAYVDKVANFDGAVLGATAIKGPEIIGRVLQIAVPGPGTPIQQQILQSIVQHGQSVRAAVNVVIFR